MAGRKYLSKIGKNNELLYLKDIEARDALLVPVNVDSLTPSSTFAKNSVIGINGVLYRATAATSNLPCTMQIQDGAFVVHVVNGKKAFVVTDPTPNNDWEIWTDAATEYWIESLNAAIAAKPSVSDIMATQVGSFTVQQLLESMAELMPHTIVTRN